jgi:hypothetical protein
LKKVQQLKRHLREGNMAMLRSLKELKGCRLLALDGEVGRVDDFYFDDDAWFVRYLVADLGGWLPGRRVLVSPLALSQPDWEQQNVPVTLTKEQIEQSPGIDLDKSVSRQQQINLHEHYDWPAYWASGGVLGRRAIAMYPEVLGETGGVGESVEDNDLAEEIAVTEPDNDPNLRSVNEVMGYAIQARDDEAGHLEDFIVDDLRWTIDYLIVGTRNWLPGKQIMLSPHWVERIDWTTAKIFFGLDQETIKNSPEYDPAEPVNKRLESVDFDYHGRLKA